MKKLFNEGDVKVFHKFAEPGDAAKFFEHAVHEVYSTFALARDMEWASRLFVIDMKDEDEEGIGTGLTLKHISPAKIGSPLDFEATITSILENEIVCKVKVRSEGRLIAIGETEQKIIDKDKLKTIFSSIE